MYTQEEIKANGFDDFRVFLYHLWKFLKLPDPTPVQYDIAYQLQYGPDKLMIEAFRGVGKSWITVAFLLWFLFMDFERKVMLVSANQKHADNLSTFAKQIIRDWDVLAHLRLTPGQPDKRDALDKWDVGPCGPDISPSVKSVGLTGQLTGGRADLIIPDDIEVTKNSYSQLLRERNAELTKEFAAVLKPNGLVRYLGTPQTEDSLYNKLPGRGYTVKVWPSEIPEKPDSYHGRLGELVTKMIVAGYKAHEPIEPTRFPRSVLDSALAEYARSGYALQFMLDTNPSDADKHPLKGRDLIVTDLDHEMCHVRYVWGRDVKIEDLPCAGFDGDHFFAPAWKTDEMTKYTGTVMAIDPSGKGKDETAYAIVRYCYGFLFLIASGGFKDGYSEATMKGLAAVAAQHRITDLVLEENFGGGMFAQLLKPHMIRAVDALKAKDTAEGKEARKQGAGSWAEDVWHSQQKELFICDTLEPIMQSHKLIVDRKVIEADNVQADEDPQYSLVYQMTHMHREKDAISHEDRLEAVAMACQFWQEQMDRDAEKMQVKHNSKLLEEELKRFKKHAITFGARGSVGSQPITAGPSNILRGRIR